MFPIILRFGVIGGLIVAVPMIVLMVAVSPSAFFKGGIVYGYTSMLIALTAVFFGVKHYRDKVLGGVIKFGTALLIGLGISFIASVLYAIGWEISLAWSGYDFAGMYSKMMIDAAHSKGGSPEAVQKAVAAAEAFGTNYRNPWYRFPLSFLEMFPVGVLVALISAALLRNSRLLPARSLS